MHELVAWLFRDHEARGTESQELRTIQAARAIAANLVVFSHLFFVEAKYPASSVFPGFTLYGIAGVDLFFVVSGFIMVAVAGRDRGAIEFLWRRATQKSTRRTGSCR